MKIAISANSYWNLYNFRFNLIKDLCQKHDVYLIAKKDKYHRKFNNLNCTCKFIDIDSRSKFILKNFLIFLNFYLILKKIQTQYHATVDNDFEILDAKFISIMLDKLDKNPNLVAMSTDYSPTQTKFYDSYSDEIICLNERWKAWFCIYKREALQCNVSHNYYEETLPNSVRRNAWDSGGYFQKILKENYGFELASLESKYQPYFIHYGAFGRNCNINENNISLYRQLRILNKTGLFGNNDIFTKKLAHGLNKLIFGNADKNRRQKLKFYNG
jgi:hypothetical protein